MSEAARNAPDFNLRDVMVSVIRRARNHDPRALAEKVAALVPVQLLRPTLAQALVDSVRIEMGTLRRSPCVHEEKVEIGAGRTESRLRFDPAAAELQMMETSGGAWKRLMDMTPEECEAAADRREAMARGNAAWAQKYRRLAKLMRETGKGRVRELPESVLCEILR